MLLSSLFCGFAPRIDCTKGFWGWKRFESHGQRWPDDPSQFGCCQPGAGTLVPAVVQLRGLAGLPGTLVCPVWTQGCPPRGQFSVPSTRFLL